MPRRMGVFDYAVPEDLVGMKRGDVVEIPLRAASVLGVVAGVEPMGEAVKGLKAVARVVAPGALSDGELGWFEAIAKDAVQSVPSVLDAAIPAPPKREATKVAEQTDAAAPLTLPADEAPAARETAAKLAGMREAFVCIPDLRRTAALVSAYLGAAPERRLVLILPNVRDARLTHERLGRFAPALLTGEDTNNARFRAWRAFRKGETRLLVGTRVAALLPPPADAAVWIARSSHENHKNADKNPRYDARACALLAHELLDVPIVFSDVCPSAGDAMRGWSVLQPFPSADVVFADMGQERKQAGHPLLGARLMEEIAHALEQGRRAVCAYNRTGMSRNVRCRDCGHAFACPSCGRVRAVGENALRCRACKTEEPIPVSCPVCMGYAIDRSGFGVEGVAAALAAAFPQATVAVAEKDGNDDAVQTADIVVATRHYADNLFDPFDPPPVGLVAVLDADMPLRAPHAGAQEQAVREAQEWRGAAHASRATFLLQSDAVGVFRDAFADPVKTATDDLANRRAYGQPPAVRAARVACRQRPPAAARAAAQRTALAAREHLPFATVDEAAPAERGEFAVLISVPHDRTPDLLAFLSGLDDAHIIDTHAET